MPGKKYSFIKLGRMKNLKISVLFVLSFVAVLVGCNKQSKQSILKNNQLLQKAKKATPKILFLMIGDGMGISQITVECIPITITLNWSVAHTLVLHKQHASDNLIMDSAAGGNCIFNRQKIK